MTARNKQILIIILFLAPISGMGIDIYTPSLPNIATVFGASHAIIKNTISTYLLGFAIGQIFSGSLSEVYGRKLILIIGMALFILACIGAAMASNIYWLLAIRFVQGLMVTAAVVMVKSIASDVFDRETMKKVSTYFVIAWSLGPIIAPVIGGYTQEYIGWWGGFVFLAIYTSIVLLAVLFILPETNVNKIPLDPKLLLNQYKIILQDKKFLGMALSLSLSYSMIIIFNVMSPFMIQKGLGYSPIQFGHIAFVIGFACLIGSISNRFLIKYIAVSKLIKYGILTVIFISLIFSILMGFYLEDTITLIMIPTFLVLLSVGVIFPNCSGQCLSEFPKMAGTASAVMGVINILGTAILALIASGIHSVKPWPIFLFYLCLGVVLIYIYYMVFGRKRKEAIGAHV